MINKSFGNFVTSTKLTLLRSKGSNLNKAFDIRIIISSVSYHKTAIGMSYKFYWSSNKINCTLYSSYVIC
jgi:hypothetical protein